MAGLSDLRLAQLASEYQELGERITDLKKKQEKRKLRILKELERRGTKAIETNEIRVTRVQSEKVITDPVKLKKRLGVQKFNRLTTRVLDPNLLSQAVQSGKIKPSTVEKCSEIKLNKPYIVVSPRKDS